MIANRCIGSLHQVPESTTYVKNAKRYVDCSICGRATFVQTRFNLKNARLGLVIVANHGIAATGAERSKAYRDRVRDAAPRTLAPCGTYAAAKRHRRKGESLDKACLGALADYQRQFNETKKIRS